MDLIDKQRCLRSERQLLLIYIDGDRLQVSLAMHQSQ